MKHFIGTRFNLKVSNWETTKSGQSVLSEEWLNNRFKLFMDYCLPSVKNQLNQNFVWCVFFDIDTPTEYKKIIKNISIDYSNFKPFFIENMNVLNDTFVDFIRASLRGHEKYVITTRIDNDDVIHKDFVQTIQNLYRPIDGCVIDLKEGFQITLDKVISIILLYRQNFNPFISVIEGTENFKTVYSRMHEDWKKSENIISYTKRRLWIEIIHKENKLNQTRFYLKRALFFNRANFGLSNNFRYEINHCNTIKINFKISLRRYIKLFRKRIKYLLKIFKGTIRVLIRRISNK